MCFLAAGEQLAIVGQPHELDLKAALDELEAGQRQVEGDNQRENGQEQHDQHGRQYKDIAGQSFCLGAQRTELAVPGQRDRGRAGRVLRLPFNLHYSVLPTTRIKEGPRARPWLGRALGVIFRPITQWPGV